METIIIKGQVTATSKKNDGNFKQQVPTKTAYISVDEASAKELEDFGLTKYSSKDQKTGETNEFFIIKFPSDLMVYLPNGMGTKRPDLSRITLDGVETNNFKTIDDKLLMMNIIKSEHMGNEFHRLQAIRVEEESDIEEIKPENPFGDVEAF